MCIFNVLLIILRLLTVRYSALPVASLAGEHCLLSREEYVPCRYEKENLTRAGAKYVCEGSCIIAFIVFGTL